MCVCVVDAYWLSHISPSLPPSCLPPSCLPSCPLQVASVAKRPLADGLEAPGALYAHKYELDVLHASIKQLRQVRWGEGQVQA